MGYHVSGKLMKVTAVVKMSWVCVAGGVSFQHSMVDSICQSVGFIDKGGVDLQLQMILALVEAMNGLGQGDQRNSNAIA